MGENRLSIVFLLALGFLSSNADAVPQDYLNPSLSAETRAADLVSRLTFLEKIRQLTNNTPAIPRLGVPAYNYSTESLHGTVAPVESTVFPQAIALAATWNTDLMYEVGNAISDEARALFHKPDGPGGSLGAGLTMLAPNLNIYRDPRWGRGQETYGEDPFLTSEMAVAYIRGLQGDHPRYYKTIATPKHFAVHSGPDSERYYFDAKVTPYDLADTYLPAFEAAVRKGRAGAIMCSYNAINGVPACANPWLLTQLLRDTWGFDGYVITDENALTTMYWMMGYAESGPQATSLALNAGSDISIGPENWLLGWQYWRGRATMEAIDRALTSVFTARFRLGLFDPPELVPYSSISPDRLNSAEHRHLARRAAREGMVLLKNDGVLPLLHSEIKTIALIGHHAVDGHLLLGNYSGTPLQITTLSDALRKRYPNIRLILATTPDVARRAAAQADLAILCLGLSEADEGEKNDRVRIELPKDQQRLWQAAYETGTKTIAVLFSGGALAFAPEMAAAVIHSWYPGQEGGDALADLLFGEENFSGRLPVTFYRSTEDLPDFRDYEMRNGHTYRYLKGPVLYPFGFGLSYSKFRHSGLRMEGIGGDPQNGVRLTVEVSNQSEREGSEVTQVYLKTPQVNGPKWVLKAFRKHRLGSFEQKIVQIELRPEDLASVGEDGVRRLLAGRYQIWVGGHQPSGTDNDLLRAEFEITDPLEAAY